MIIRNNGYLIKGKRCNAAKLKIDKYRSDIGKYNDGGWVNNRAMTMIKKWNGVKRLSFLSNNLISSDVEIQLFIVKLLKRKANYNSASLR